jgi:tetratricopeptide (TPR) repeat protein
MHNRPAAKHQVAPSRLLRRARRAERNGDLAESERLYRELVQCDGPHFDALHGLGKVHRQRARPDAALACFQDALKCDPFRAEGFLDLGLVFHALRDFRRALASFEEGLRLDPADPQLLNGSGVALLELRRPQDALVFFDRALELAPDHAGEALAAYERALALAPDNAPLLANRAAALRRLDRPHEAITSARKALALRPDFAHARFVESVACLSLGDFEAGWRAYESRWQIGWLASQRRDFGAPLWRGDESLAGKAILLHAEQGLGDTLQFARYAPLLAEKGATVFLEVQAQLVRLVSCMDGVSAVFARESPLPPYDFHCPLLSLPLACATALQSIPADVPYLSADRAMVARWGARLPRRRPLIGLTWSGERSHDNDLNRSMRLATLAPLFDLPDLTFVSLQHEVREEDAALLAARGEVLSIGADFKDFSDTAAAIGALDAVISVDTAVAHLAGALGKPLFLLLPFAADFRWLRERCDSPWYPTARLFRQPQFGDWPGAVNMLRDTLARLRVSRAA